MTKSAEPKIPVRIRRLLIKMGGGKQVLCKQTAPRGGEDRFWLEPSGKDVAMKTCLLAIDRGFVVPNQDGLFGDSQTYRVAS